MTIKNRGRRADYAEATRAAIIDAARTLFAEQGYFATRVEQIATKARVAEGTVYVAGGKQGLLHLLIEEWARSPVRQDSIDRLAELEDPEDILRLLAASTKQVRQTHGDIMRILLATAPHDQVAADGLAASTARYQATLALVAKRLHDVGHLRADITVRRATDVLWFYFGYTGFFTLIDNGWTLDDAETWLREQCERALIAAPPH
ncbi:TetR/AcrR family transcriptional regulator [Streptomyces olivaceus]|uniref:TetR/AcrR family transcriptional regulator n=1 Tax=Streptomyces olivaceus TaxID=47716 RepID=UPI0033BE63C1